MGTWKYRIPEQVVIEKKITTLSKLNVSKNIGEHAKNVGLKVVPDTNHGILLLSLAVMLCLLIRDESKTPFEICK